jgi:DNA replication protein DnaC
MPSLTTKHGRTKRPASLCDDEDEVSLTTDLTRRTTSGGGASGRKRHAGNTSSKRRPRSDSTTSDEGQAATASAASSTSRAAHEEHVTSLEDGPVPSMVTMTQPRTDTAQAQVASFKERWNFQTLDDLISIACDKANHDCPEVRRLIHTVPSLLILRDIIGQEKLKAAMIEQVLYFCQGFERDEMLNMCLLGGPGLGKSLICGIICDIYQQLRILPHFPGDEETLSNTVEKYLRGTRASMVARYLGQTADKTRKLIDRCVRESKILLMDEVYQMNNTKADDSFSKDALDQLNQLMTENAGKLIVIIAGYPEEVERCFFATNKGLISRFTKKNHVVFEDYTPAELRQIFLLKATDENWSVDEDAVTEEWFKEQKDHFPYQARDIETLFIRCKMVHARRVFGQDESVKRRLTRDDLSKALDQFMESNKKNEDVSYRHMYT